MDRPVRQMMSAGQKATTVFCGLFAGTGLVALVLFGASGIFPALLGSIVIAGPLAVVAYVVFLRAEDRKEVS